MIIIFFFSFLDISLLLNSNVSDLLSREPRLRLWVGHFCQAGRPVSLSLALLESFHQELR